MQQLRVDLLPPPWRTGTTTEYKRGHYYLSRTVWQDGHEEVEIHRCRPEQLAHLYDGEEVSDAEPVLHTCDPNQFPAIFERFKQLTDHEAPTTTGVWREIPQPEIFQTGDVRALCNERCKSCDGDRSTFTPHRSMLLRPCEKLPVQQPKQYPRREGMRQSLTGVLVRLSPILKRDGDPMAYRTVLDKLQVDLKELSQRFYAGDIAAVDEFLQLYDLDEPRAKSAKVATETSNPKPS